MPARPPRRDEFVGRHGVLRQCTASTGGQMLTAAKAVAFLPSSDLDRSRAFFAGTLGLSVEDIKWVRLRPARWRDDAAGG